MKKQRLQYGISGYRWAPESYHASKGLIGQGKKEIPLTDEERREVGYRYLTEGFRSAVGHVKHIERMREREQHCRITYGFWTKEEYQRYVWCPQIFCGTDAPLAERLRVFKAVRNEFARTDGKVETSTCCELDGDYRPANITKTTVTADFSQPLKIWLIAALRRGS